MSLKAATRTCLAWVLASGLVMGESAPPAAEGAAPDPAPLPGSASAPPPGSATDLDFGEDFPASDGGGPAGAEANPGGRVTPMSPPASAAAAPAPSRSWAYWTAGLAALAAGGTAWYLHWGARSAPDPVRDNQVFTDEAD